MKKTLQFLTLQPFTTKVNLCKNQKIKVCVKLIVISLFLNKKKYFSLVEKLIDCLIP